MTPEQIKHMVDRFLNWRLPANFAPDNGITAVRPNYHPNVQWEPMGTNLLDATQADAMVRHMIEGLPQSAPETPRAHHWVPATTGAGNWRCSLCGVNSFDAGGARSCAGNRSAPERGGDEVYTQEDLDRADAKAAEIIAAIPVDDGWIEWKGGERPVGVSAIVETRWRSGHESGETIAGANRWSHTGEDRDIIAYRVATP